MKPKLAVSLAVWLVICIAAAAITVIGLQAIAKPLGLQERVARFAM